nr:hypothetical protein [Amycolatopsis acidiphila]
MPGVAQHAESAEQGDHREDDGLAGEGGAQPGSGPVGEADGEPAACQRTGEERADGDRGGGQ